MDVVTAATDKPVKAQLAWQTPVLTKLAMIDAQAKIFSVSEGGPFGPS